MEATLQTRGRLNPPPSEADARLAAEAARSLVASLARSRKKSPGARRIRVSAGGGEEQAVVVPPEAFDLFLQILAQMAEGNAVTIVPIHAILTTQQAADLLNVSRPYLIGLLGEGKIPFRKVGTHRRIAFADLVAYQQQDEAERKLAMDELTAQAQRDEDY